MHCDRRSQRRNRFLGMAAFQQRQPKIVQYCGIVRGRLHRQPKRTDRVGWAPGFQRLRSLRQPARNLRGSGQVLRAAAWAAKLTALSRCGDARCRRLP